MKFNVVLARLLFCFVGCVAPVSIVLAETEVSAQSAPQPVVFDRMGAVVLIRPGNNFSFSKRLDVALLASELEFASNALVDALAPVLAAQYSLNEDLAQDLQAFVRKYAVKMVLFEYIRPLLSQVQRFTSGSSDESAFVGKISSELALEPAQALLGGWISFVEQALSNAYVLIEKHWPAFDLEMVKRAGEMYLAALKTGQDLSEEDEAFVGGSVQALQAFVLPSVTPEKINEEVMRVMGQAAAPIQMLALSGKIPTLLQLFAGQSFRGFTTYATAQFGFVRGDDARGSALDDFYAVYDFASNTLYTKLSVTKDDSLNMDGGFKGCFSYADDGSIAGLTVAPSVNVVTSVDESDAIKSFDSFGCMSIDPQPNFMVFSA